MTCQLDVWFGAVPLANAFLDTLTASNYHFDVDHRLDHRPQADRVFAIVEPNQHIEHCKSIESEHKQIVPNQSLGLAFYTRRVSHWFALQEIACCQIIEMSGTFSRIMKIQFNQTCDESK